MSSVIGISGFDPVFKETYVLIAGDSQASLKNIKTNKIIGSPFFDKMKVASNSDSSLIIGTVGKSILPEDANKIGLAILSRELFSSKNIDDTKTEELLNLISHFRSNNSYLYSNFPHRLDLFISNSHSNSTHIYKGIPGYFIGSGSDVKNKNGVSLENLFIDTVQSLPVINYTSYELKMADAFNLLQDYISLAEKGDDFTGGHIKWLLRTRIGVFGNTFNLPFSENLNLLKEESHYLSNKSILQGTVSSVEELVFKGL